MRIAMPKCDAIGCAGREEFYSTLLWAMAGSVVVAIVGLLIFVYFIAPLMNTKDSYVREDGSRVVTITHRKTGEVRVKVKPPRFWR